MFPLDYLIAAALLSGPPGLDDPPGSVAVYAGLLPTVQELAVSWEILDPREARFLFSRPEDFRSDMSLLRQRRVDLDGAPPLHDCQRFPPREAVSEMLAFNRAYRELIEKCQVAGAAPGQDYQETLREVDRLYQVWDAVRDSRCEYYYITVRRQALKKVRTTIGDAAFYNGHYPPHVPVWRFQRID